MRKLNLLLSVVAFCFATLSSYAQAPQTTVAGPDGKLIVSVDVPNAVYSVKYDGKDMLNASPFGLLVDLGYMPTMEGIPADKAGDFTSGLTLVESKASKIDQEYSLDRIKQDKVHYVANELVLTLKNALSEKMDVTFRVSDNDIALRYTVYPTSKGRQSGRVLDEKTGFRFPDGTTTFLTPQSDPMIGWQRSKPSYEEDYTNDDPMDQKSHYGHGYTFPCLFHVGDAGWVLVSETGVSSDYCGSRLGDFIDGVYKVEYPMPQENNGNGTVAPALRLPGSTPWRTITVGSTLKPIVETTAPWDNVEPVYKTTHDYKYGKSTWSWIVWQDASMNWDDQVAYIDLAAQMGYEYILIDAGWDQQIGYDRMPDLIKYANSKNVDVFLWYSSSGYWNDIFQSPINRMDNSIIRKKEMAWLEKNNVKGIKVDFWGGDKQETMRLYEEVLSDADDHGLMVIFHGCTLPRGWERMYPNYVGSEAVLASENLIFGQRACDIEAFKATLHPFIRNAVGCMEFGGCFMNKRYNRTNDGGTTRKTTDVFQLCTEILFQNPIQNIAITPNNMYDAPKICMDFLREVPTTWNETKFIEGYPGKYVVLARRHGDTWYIAGINASEETVTLDLDLTWLGEGQYRIYSDDAQKNPVLETPSIVIKKKNKPVKVTLQTGGGVLIVK